MNRDLTKGNPSAELVKFSLPLLGSMIFQQLYNIADSFVAGKFIHENALAAVGNSYEITLIYIAFAFGCNIGCSVIVSNLFGGKRYSAMKTAVSTTFIASGILCAVLMAVGLLFGRNMLALIRTPDDIMADSLLYLNIYTMGLLFLFFYNIATGIFSAMGDSRTPFILLACSSTANIFVDILFVKEFQMGVAGVGWATFLCQGISCGAAVLLVFKRLAKIKNEDVHKPQIFSWGLLGKITNIAVPSILQQSFVSVGNIIIQSVINGYGAPVIAGYSAAIKLNNMVITSFTTLGNGVSNFTAQNMGAGRTERVGSGLKGGLKLVYIICIPVAALYMLGGKSILLLFINDRTGDAMKTGIQILRILAPFYFVVSTKLMCDGVLRGAGAMKSFMITTFTDLILRVVLAVMLSARFGVVGIWSAWPVGWSIGTAMSIYFYAVGRWKSYSIT